MAQPMLCDNQDGNPGAMLVTNLSDGDTLALCGWCWPRWCKAMVDAFEQGPASANGTELEAPEAPETVDHGGEGPPDGGFPGEPGGGEGEGEPVTDTPAPSRPKSAPRGAARTKTPQRG